MVQIRYHTYNTAINFYKFSIKSAKCVYNYGSFEAQNARNEPIRILMSNAKAKSEQQIMKGQKTKQIIDGWKKPQRWIEVKRHIHNRHIPPIQNPYPYPYPFPRPVFEVCTYIFGVGFPVHDFELLFRALSVIISSEERFISSSELWYLGLKKGLDRINVCMHH